MWDYNTLILVSVPDAAAAGTSGMYLGDLQHALQERTSGWRYNKQEGRASSGRDERRVQGRICTPGT